MALHELAASVGTDTVGRAIARDVEAELTAHLALAAEALEHEGQAPEEARRLARARFGDIRRIRSECLRARLGGVHAMQKMFVATIVVSVVALGISLFTARAQHVRAQEAMAEAMAARDRAEQAFKQARLAALTPVDYIVVEVGDQIEIVDQHRIADIAQLAEVQPDGQVLLADIGWVEVAGLTRQEVEQRLTEAFVPFYEDLEAVNVIVHKAAPFTKALFADLSGAPAPVVVEIGDRIETLDKHRRIDFGEQAVVQPDGKVLLHDLGWVDAVGLTCEELERRLTEAYAPFYEGLTVNVIVHKRQNRTTTSTSERFSDF